MWGEGCTYWWGWVALSCILRAGARPGRGRARAHCPRAPHADGPLGKWGVRGRGQRGGRERGLQKQREVNRLHPHLAFCGEGKNQPKDPKRQRRHPTPRNPGWAGTTFRCGCSGGRGWASRWRAGRGHTHTHSHAHGRGDPRRARGARPGRACLRVRAGTGRGERRGAATGGWRMAVAGRAPAARVCSRSLRLPSVLSFLLFFLQNLPGNFVFYSVFFFSLIFFPPFLSSRCCRGYVLLAKFVVPPLRFPHSPRFGSVQCPFVCRHTAGFFLPLFQENWNSLGSKWILRRTMLKISFWIFKKRFTKKLLKFSHQFSFILSTSKYLWLQSRCKRGLVIR